MTLCHCSSFWFQNCSGMFSIVARVLSLQHLHFHLSHSFPTPRGSVEATHTPPQLPQHEAINPRTNSRGQLVLPLPISYHQLFSGIVQLIYSTIRGGKRQERQKSKLLLASSSWAQNIWRFTFVIRGNLIKGQHGDLAIKLSVWCPAAVRGDAMSRAEGGGRSL